MPFQPPVESPLSSARLLLLPPSETEEGEGDCESPLRAHPESDSDAPNGCIDDVAAAVTRRRRRRGSGGGDQPGHLSLLLHVLGHVIRLYPMQAAVLMAFLAAGTAQGVAECMSGNRVMCFNCNSHEDYRCRDAFNWTDLPEKKACEGCCVKMVQGIGTGEEPQIRRMCTSDLRINMFMVDHVCMSQSNRRGHLCFCEQNECNGATTNANLHDALATAILVMLVMGSMFNRAR